MNKQKILKAFTSLLLIMSFLVTVLLPSVYAVDLAEETVSGSASDTGDTVFPVIELIDDSDASIASSSTTKKYSVSWTVAAGATATGSTAYYMSVGDTVTFSISYTPTTSSVQLGMYNSLGTYTYYTRSNGSLTSTLSITKAGVQKFRIINNSDSEITVTGTYTINATSPFTYMFKSPYYASYLSSLYGESRSDSNHYAIDITTGKSGEIKGYPVYNTLSGKVIYRGTFSDGVTTCVAVTHDNGFTSRYLHMDNSSSFSVGDTIETGTQVGTVCDNGSTDAYHLHYDINSIGTHVGTNYTDKNTINPVYVFPDVTFSS